MIRRFVFYIMLAAALAGTFWWATRPRPASAPPELQLSPIEDLSQFARAVEVRDFVFPRDHGPHFDYQTEWWYYTGNLTTSAGEHFGYQLTFFRRGLTPGLPAERLGLATNQIYFAHFAVSDVPGGRHIFSERYSRGAAGLSGASGQPFRVWLEDWSAEALNADGSAVRLRAREGDLAIDLRLRAVKPIVAHGEAGLSPKSEVPGNASYYLSYTRMATEGTITLGTESQAVRGESWFDHEWSTSALGEGAIGWDWFSLQLDDGREVMFFQIRRKDGSLEPASSGTLVEPDGTAVRLSAADVLIDVRDTWRSPATGAEYPASWRLQIPSAQIDLSIEPWLAEQEMRVTGTYWEGAVRITGTSDGRPIMGLGYIELTGYADSLEDVF